MSEEEHPSNESEKRLAKILIAIFIFALIMGPGPGLYLINGYAAEGGTILGIPAMYAWAVFWCVVEAGVIATAYVKLWREGSR